MIAIDHRCHFSYCAARLASSAPEREEECRQDGGACRVVTTIAPTKMHKYKNTQIHKTRNINKNTKTRCKIQEYNYANEQSVFKYSIWPKIHFSYCFMIVWDKITCQAKFGAHVTSVVTWALGRHVSSLTPWLSPIPGICDG